MRDFFRFVFVVVVKMLFFMLFEKRCLLKFKDQDNTGSCGFLPKALRVKGDLMK